MPSGTTEPTGSQSVVWGQFGGLCTHLSAQSPAREEEEEESGLPEGKQALPETARPDSRCPRGAVVWSTGLKSRLDPSTGVVTLTRLQSSVDVQEAGWGKSKDTTGGGGSAVTGQSQLRLDHPQGVALEGSRCEVIPSLPRRPSRVLYCIHLSLAAVIHTCPGARSSPYGTNQAG